MKKDKMVSARINGEILDYLKKNGVSFQKILDDYIKKNVKITTKIGRQK